VALVRRAAVVGDHDKVVTVGVGFVAIVTVDIVVAYSVPVRLHVVHLRMR